MKMFMERVGMFGSRSITLHVLRGALAAACLFAAFKLHSVLLAALAIIAAIVLLRGCPMCWTVGLCETVARRIGARRNTQDNPS